MDLDNDNLFVAYFIIFIILYIFLTYHVYIYTEAGHTPEVEKEKKFTDYVNTAHSGLIRGLVFGVILGDLGLYTGVKNAVIYSVLNPAFMYFGY